MSLIHYVAFQGIIDERMQRQSQILGENGWNVRFFLVHPRKGWVVRYSEGNHLIVPERTVSNPVFNEFVIIPILLFLRYLQIVSTTRERASLIYVLNFPNVFAIPFLIAARILMIPSIYEIRDLWKESVVAESGSKARERLRFRPYYRLLALIEQVPIKLASGLVFVNEDLRDLSDSVSRGKPVLILNNYSTFDSTPPVEARAKKIREQLGIDSTFVISYIGSMQSYRGITTLLRSVAYLRGADLRLTLLIVGAHGDALEYLASMAKEMRIEDQCRIIGWVPNEDVVFYYSASDVGVIPFKRTLVTEYATPNKLFDYLVMGKPVIVSSLKGMSRIVSEGINGSVFPPDDYVALATAIQTLASNRKLIAEMRSLVASSREMYALSGHKREFLDFVSQVCSSQKAIM